MDFENCGVLNCLDDRIEKKLDKWASEYDKRRMLEVETITEHINSLNDHVNKVEGKVDKIYDLMLQSAKEEAKEAKTKSIGVWNFLGKLFDKQNRKFTFSILTFVIILIWSNADKVTEIIKTIFK